MNNSMKMGLVKVTLFSILLSLSVMASIASADGVFPIRFYGNATLNDEPATTGIVINTYIDDEHSGTYTITVDGQYYIDVQGNESDEGEPITFEICGATADQTDTWHASANAESRPLNLTAEDDEAPAVENANANPPSIVADGVKMTQLSATVTDGCGVDSVTVNLSAIGGDGAQEMTCTGDTDVYTVTVTAAEGTAPGVHCLQVNASDVFGTCNTSVCIDLVIKDVEAPVVSNPDANPATIVANGTHESRLNVTVVDDSDIDFVTVNLSAIGGSDVQTMARIEGTDVYSVTVNATEGTPADTYYLYVNASDVFGKYNTSVYIELKIIGTTTYAKGDLNHNGQVADSADVAMMLSASVGDIAANSEYDLNGNSQNADSADVAMMLSASVGDITL